MCKKLLTFVVVLSMVSVALAIDDFDTYPDTAALQTRWIDVSVDNQGDASGASSAVGTLVTGAPPIVAEGGAAMEVTFTLNGGWVYPNALPPWDPGYVKKEWEAIADTASIKLNLIHPVYMSSYGDDFLLYINIHPKTSLDDLGDLNIIGYGKDKDGKDVFARTLVPCLRDLDQNWLQWWYLTGGEPDKMKIPAILGNVANLGGSPWENAYVIPICSWGELEINIDTQIWPWNWGNVGWQELVTLEAIEILVNSDTDLTTDMRELEGGDKYPIKGGTYVLNFDSIRTECIPEPATIALLGLGGLAMLRRKRAK